ncbi:Nickel efflux system [Venustampulla echinocandica]|uniref:Nickel/cobalt efflux system n=1 Tax=Venustampulla echinocandica TaxID=2656787 RepID=A0A370TGT9_9HELO|nr:Nickel efflux system [Venustampulla echinocandica]RDL34414.1 Nickel efflux system [Venustampulla echinocandica]
MRCLHRPQWGLRERLTSAIPPQLRLLSFPAVLVIFLLVLVNAVLWVAVAIILRSHPTLASSAILSYTLGLRHALDADHITAIDLMTRRLVATGSKPVTVGMWFSLGHSTIVVITCIVVAATSGALEKRFEGFSKVGGIIGTSVSAAVLLLLAVANGWILFKLIQRMRVILREEVADDREDVVGNEGVVAGMNLEGGGLMVRLFKKVFRLIDRPWKMYPLGVLFGLGFDTSSEIAVLGIASVQGAKGTDIWLILIFPLLFTAGMCLIDTTDGALMMTLYTSTSLARDTIAILYYSIVLTAITVVVALAIGIIQLLSLISNFSSGSFWDGVDAVGDHYPEVGGAICGSFVFFGALSMVLHKPWRRRFDRHYDENRFDIVMLDDSGDKQCQGTTPITVLEEPKPSYGVETIDASDPEKSSSMPASKV